MGGEDLASCALEQVEGPAGPMFAQFFRSPPRPRLLIPLSPAAIAPLVAGSIDSGQLGLGWTDLHCRSWVQAREEAGRRRRSWDKLVGGEPCWWRRVLAFASRHVMVLSRQSSGRKGPVLSWSASVHLFSDKILRTVIFHLQVCWLIHVSGLVLTPAENVVYRLCFENCKRT
jgi:hypothetical protein